MLRPSIFNSSSSHLALEESNATSSGSNSFFSVISFVAASNSCAVSYGSQAQGVRSWQGNHEHSHFITCCTPSITIINWTQTSSPQWKKGTTFKIKKKKEKVILKWKPFQTILSLCQLHFLFRAFIFCVTNRRKVSMKSYKTKWQICFK